MSPLIDRVAAFWSRVNGGLFPALEEAGIEMTPKLYQLVTLLDLLQIELFVPRRSPGSGWSSSPRSRAARGSGRRGRRYTSGTRSSPCSSYRPSRRPPAHAGSYALKVKAREVDGIDEVEGVQSYQVTP